MKINGEIREGAMPENYELLFQRKVDLDGQLAIQQFWGETKDGCGNAFAMKYEIIEESKDVFTLLQELAKVMEETRLALVEKEKYEDASDVSKVLEALRQLKSRKA